MRGESARPSRTDDYEDTNERRQLSRRSRGPDRGSAIPSLHAPHEGLPRRWPWLILAMIGAVAGSATATLSVPGALAATCLGLALIGACAIGQARKIAFGKGPLPRRAAIAAAAVLPMFLFGLGMTAWVARDGLPWSVAVASLLCVGGLAAAYLRRLPVAMFAAQLAIWSAAVIVHQSLPGTMALATALAVVVMVSRELDREQKFEDERRRARDRVQSRARDILADYEQTGQGWFWETDRRSLLTYVSAPVAASLGVPRDALIGQPLVALFDLADTKEGERTLMFHFSARSSFQELPVRAAIRDEVRWWSVSGRPIHDEFGNFVGFRGSGTDLTAKRQSEEHASRLAHYDSLTGLANRFQMSQALEKILTAEHAGNRTCAVMLLDLDRFKRVNDTMGHPAGDALLKQVAQRLERAVGKTGQVGRLGGDEFEVIVPGRIERRRLGQLASEVIHSLSQPYTIEGQPVVIGASVGIVLSPDDGTSSEELIRNADLALYAAKDMGRARFHFYAEDLHTEAESRARIEQDLRQAIAEGQLQLYYQPIVATATERITGFEALLRWHHPQNGWIPPGGFVQIAEDTGLIAEVGEWALRTACQDLARWPEDVRVAVNVSPLQFAKPDLPAIVSSAIATAGIDPSRLELEITESVFLTDDADTDAMFAALKRIGVRLALDDFGTGYSSLGYLKKAPFDKIKIDQSFVRGATQPDSRNGAIIASITSLAHALGMDTTAEGVETMDELDLVRMHGCSHVQGYIYERPLSAEDATARLETDLSAIARGPRAARAPRRTMLRKVVLERDGQPHDATIRNLSATGGLIEGLWNVAPGTVVWVRFSDAAVVEATVRWCEEDRMGVEFAAPLEHDGKGRILALQGPPSRPAARSLLKKAG